VIAAADCAYAPTVVLLSALVLGEPLSLGVLLGTPLVVAGLFWASQPEKRTPSRVEPIGLLGVLGGVVLTAVGVIIAKPALERSNLIEATTLRLASGALPIAMVEIFGQRKAWARLAGLLAPRTGIRLLVGSVFGTYLSMLLWLGGMKYTSASRAAILNQMGAVFLLVISRLIGEKIPLRKWLGAGIAVLGALCVIASRE
ncbi:MAG: DMT family transporter, partial [Sandaracinaceae bacterium]|nr:DMT family transporter [Sandaracinaceae bacterium]